MYITVVISKLVAAALYCTVSKLMEATLIKQGNTNWASYVVAANAPALGTEILALLLSCLSMLVSMVVAYTHNHNNHQTAS